MSYVLEGFKQAINLLMGFDLETYQIIGLSIYVSLSSTLLAAIVGIPLGIFTGLSRFPFKKAYGTFLYTAMGIPPVVIGLLVALFLSRKGPLGSYELLFTPEAMIIAQFFLVFPIVCGILFGTTHQKGIIVYELALTLGANKRERLKLMIFELKHTIVLAIMTGFGRGISEVGAVMLVGGNIKGHTRVMTTFIAMNNSMGSYEKSIAMAIVLFGIVLFINALVHHLSGGDSHVNEM